jgi:hypothetical protein
MAPAPLFYHGLLTYAKKVTVSVLCWYTNFPGPQGPKFYLKKGTEPKTQKPGGEQRSESKSKSEEKIQKKKHAQKGEHKRTETRAQKGKSQRENHRPPNRAPQ